MTDQTDTTTAEARERRTGEARNFARQAVHGVAREMGAQASSRPMFRHDPASLAVHDFDPAAGMRAARDVELAARREALGYIKTGRQDGMTWNAIGTALGITAGGYRAAEGVAEAAFDYAAGDPSSDYARTYGRSFPWTCPACLGVVSDRGPCSGPHDDEPGHKPGCGRLAADVAAWEARWAELDADEDGG
jgi:hypothetical protein